MCKQFFKRSNQTQALLILFVAMLSFAILFIWQIKDGGDFSEISFTLLVIILIVAMVFVIALIIPDDFQYWIRVEGDYIIFEKNETDHRPILRKYVVIKENYKIMVLEDERGTIISIPYDAEVREFLKQHRIE